jgi:hypothetical protein
VNPIEYAFYTVSDCWRIRRDQYVRRHPLCEICRHVPLPNEKIQVHHLTYERLGREKDDDLLATCEQCHRALHGFEGTADWAKIMLATLKNDEAIFPRQKTRDTMKMLEG